LFLFGGFNGNERLNENFVYDFDSGHWSQIDGTGGDVPSGRSSLVAQIYENALYVFGGYNGTNV
jgi:leucine-zipper-like transcriptional regulator 1